MKKICQMGRERGIEVIIDGAHAFTQFPFNRNADKQSFPIRNRIVAGLTLGTVVVKAVVAVLALEVSTS